MIQNALNSIPKIEEKFKKLYYKENTSLSKFDWDSWDSYDPHMQHYKKDINKKHLKCEYLIPCMICDLMIGANKNNKRKH